MLTRVLTRSETESAARHLARCLLATTAAAGLTALGARLAIPWWPVPAAALSELGVDARDLAEAVMAAYAAEVESIAAAQRKVRPVE